MLYLQFGTLCFLCRKIISQKWRERNFFRPSTEAQSSLTLRGAISLGMYTCLSHFTKGHHSTTGVGPNSREIGKLLWYLPALITSEQDRAGWSMAAHLCAVSLDYGWSWLGLPLSPKGSRQSVRVLSISDTVIKASLCKYWIAFNAYLCASSLEPATASVTTRI